MDHPSNTLESNNNPSPVTEIGESSNNLSTPKLRYGTRRSSSLEHDDGNDKDKVNKKKLALSHRLKLFVQNQASKNMVKLRKYKILAFALDKFDRMSPNKKKLALILFILFKILWAMFTMYLVYNGTSKLVKKKGLKQANFTTPLDSTGVSIHTEHQLPLNIGSNATQSRPFRILHIVTSLTEYNTGLRNTIKGQDRLVDIMIPCIKGAVNSMTKQPNWSVDVYLILGFNLSPARRALVKKELPPDVGLEVWSDATPYGYDEITAKTKGEDPKIIRAVTRGLSRQHRYVILDKLEHYDFFTAFEDDMRITASQVEAFMDMTRKIDGIRESSEEGNSRDSVSDSISGQMTKKQLGA